MPLARSPSSITKSIIGNLGAPLQFISTDVYESDVDENESPVSAYPASEILIEEHQHLIEPRYALPCVHSLTYRFIRSSYKRQSSSVSTTRSLGDLFEDRAYGSRVLRLMFRRTSQLTGITFFSVSETAHQPLHNTIEEVQLTEGAEG